MIVHGLTIPIYEAAIACFEMKIRAICKTEQTMSDRKRVLLYERNIAVFQTKIKSIQNEQITSRNQISR